jgi:hypothetical protein
MNPAWIETTIPKIEWLNADAATELVKLLYACTKIIQQSSDLVVWRLLHASCCGYLQ